MDAERRGFWGGLCMAIGGLPLLLYYGLHPLGFLGLGLVGMGLLVSYGARRISIEYST